MKHVAISNVSIEQFSKMVKTEISQMSTNKAVKAVRRIRAGEGTVPEIQKRWTIDKEGIIYIDLPVTTGITGPQWSEMLNTSPWADSLLHNSDDFWVTTGKVYKIAIIPGKFFSNSDRNMANLRKEMDRRNLLYGDKISPEIGCLLRKYLSDQDMACLGLGWFTIMHEPIKDSSGDFCLLSVDRNGYDFLITRYGRPGRQWGDDDAFVGVVSQDT